MLNNITALNIEELKTKIVKAGIGKYSKPAKLSSGENFKKKAMEFMNKTNAPVSTLAAPVETAPTPAPEVTPSVSEPVSQAPEVPKEEVMTPVELPTPEKVIERVKKVNISVVEVPNDGVKVASPSKKLKVSKMVVTNTSNTLRVLESVPKEEVKEEAPALSEEVQVAPEVNVAPAPTEAPEETDQSNFFLGQKINTEEITENEEEPKETTEEMVPETKEQVEVEVPKTDMEVTQEEKEDKLNQYLNSNQETVQGNDTTDDLNLDDVLRDLDDYKKASEQIFDRQSEINKLNKDLEDAKKMLAEKKKEAQRMLGDARKILEDQKNEINSKTQELSDVRDAIIRWTELKEKNQSRSQEETSLGKVA